MPIWISEYGTFANPNLGNNPAVRGTNPMVPVEPAIRTQQMSSGSSAAVTSIQFSSATNIVRVSGDVAGFLFFGSSVTSTLTSTISSTSAYRVAAGNDVYRGVLPNSKLWAFST